MGKKSLLILIATLIAICGSQRLPILGGRPFGYPTIISTTSASPASVVLGNRLGEGQTEELPAEALGDREFFNRLGELPQDKQPFWYLNLQALKDNQENPKTYPVRPSFFNENATRNVEDTIQDSPNTQLPPRNNQVFVDNEQPSQINQDLSNTQRPVQNNKDLSSTQTIKNN